jgi:hypothetical protein
MLDLRWIVYTLFWVSTIPGEVHLAHLRVLPELKELSIAKTRVTDAGLHHLTCLTKLDWLEWEKSCVTARGVENLQKVLPALNQMP